MKNENINNRISFDGNNLLNSNNESIKKVIADDNNNFPFEQNQMINYDGYNEIIDKTEELFSKHSNVEILKRKYKYFTPRSSYSLNKIKNTKTIDISKSSKSNKNKSKSKEKNISLRDKIKLKEEYSKKLHKKNVVEKIENPKYQFNIHFNYSDRETLNKLKTLKLENKVRYPHFTYEPKGYKNTVTFSEQVYKNNYNNMDFDMTPYKDILNEAENNHMEGYVDLFLKKETGKTQFRERPMCFKRIIEGNTLDENLFGYDSNLNKYQSKVSFYDILNDRNLDYEKENQKNMKCLYDKSFQKLDYKVNNYIKTNY